MSNLIFNLVKMVVSLFPPTWPFKIYNMLLRVPFIKRPMSWAIQRVTPRELKIPEGTIVFDKDDPAMSGAITLGQYEPEMMSFFRSCLKEGMTLVDIGANLGYFTVIAASRVGPAGKVFAYEPDPHNFELLQKNISINGFGNVKASSTAISDRRGTRELFFGDNNTTHSFGDKRGTGRSETVVTDTLDDSLRLLGSPHIDVIKMDIEGAEPIALEGMQDTLTKNPNIIVIFEFHPNAIKRLGSSPLALLERFEGLGFSLSVIDEDKKARTPINDIAVFADSFQGKELSKNLIAVRL